MDIFTRAWWRAALTRAVYTLLAAAVPLVTQVVAGEVSPLYAGSILGLATLASVITSLAGLPELTDRALPLWRAVVYRVLRTVAQVAVPVLGAAIVLQDVSWTELLTSVGGAAAVTLLRALMMALPALPSLPETTRAELVADVDKSGAYRARLRE